MVFMGSPEYALPSLRKLATHYLVVGVVTQPDRPAGRGNTLTPPPVKMLAQQLGLPIIQPNRMKDPGVFEQLEAWQPDLIVVAAFGKILRQNVLALPRFGCLNVHASYLPRWRGAAPIQAAIAAGDESSGVSIIRLDAGVDTGPLLARRSEAIHPEDTAASLGARLAEMGAQLLIETLPAYINGDLTPQPQDEFLATYAPMLTKTDGALDFNLDAHTLARRVRAYDPWPGVYMDWQSAPLKILRAHAIEGNFAPGSRLVIHKLPAVACMQGCLVFDEVQPAGKKPMPAAVFLNGARGWADG